MPPDSPDNPPSRPTIATIARKAGVSASTVSRALRNQHLVNKETREAIHRAAQELGYAPNPYISALMSHLRASRPIPYQANIALLDTLPDANDWKRYFVQVQFHEGAERQAQRLGYQLERVWVGGHRAAADRLTRVLVARGIRGVLIPPLEDHASSGADVPLRLEQFACVTIGCRVTDPDLHFATNDQFFTSQLAHAKLLDLGYRRVGLVVPGYIEEIVECRFSAGFRNALEIRGARPVRDAVLRYDRGAGAEPVMKWFRRFRPDAICTIFPEVADWLKSNSIRVPEDVSFASLDWGPPCRDWAGVDQKSARVGAAAVDVIVQLLQRNELGPPEHIFGVSIEGAWVDGATAPGRL